MGHRLNGLCLPAGLPLILGEMINPLFKMGPRNMGFNVLSNSKWTLIMGQMIKFQFNWTLSKEPQLLMPQNLYLSFCALISRIWYSLGLNGLNC